jgi:chromosome segregation ATPase
MSQQTGYVTDYSNQVSRLEQTNRELGEEIEDLNHQISGVRLMNLEKSEEIGRLQRRVDGLEQQCLAKQELVESLELEQSKWKKVCRDSQAEACGLHLELRQNRTRQQKAAARETEQKQTIKTLRERLQELESNPDSIPHSTDFKRPRGTGLNFQLKNLGSEACQNPYVVTPPAEYMAE